MSTDQLLLCYNKGCGKQYKDDENGEGNDCSLDSWQAKLEVSCRLCDTQNFTTFFPLVQ